MLRALFLLTLVLVSSKKKKQAKGLIPALSSSGRELCLVRTLAASSFQQKFVISTQRIPFGLKGLGKTHLLLPWRWNQMFLLCLFLG